MHRWLCLPLLLLRAGPAPQVAGGRVWHWPRPCAEALCCGGICGACSCCCFRRACSRPCCGSPRRLLAAATGCLPLRLLLLLGVCLPRRAAGRRGGRPGSTQPGYSLGGLGGHSSGATARPSCWGCGCTRAPPGHHGGWFGGAAGTPGARRLSSSSSSSSACCCCCWCCRWRSPLGLVRWLLPALLHPLAPNASGTCSSRTHRGQ
jgi:hypothetical protein